MVRKDTNKKRIRDGEGSTNIVTLINYIKYRISSAKL
jgi:hypothetical protein